MVAHDAIVLAGGAGRRMGGAVKPQVELQGRRLLDHVLEATTQASSVVVVAPEAVPVPAGVQRTLEYPPLGGPVAGIAAGLAAIREPAPWVLVLACDVPGTAAAVPRLLAAARGVATREEVGRSPAVAGGVNAAAGEDAAGGTGGVVLRDAEGREQWLLGVYSSPLLRARVEDLAGARGLRGRSVGELVASLHLQSLPTVGTEARDIDTWADLDAVEPGPGRPGEG